jgi:hypothetical protein
MKNVKYKLKNDFKAMELKLQVAVPARKHASDERITFTLSDALALVYEKSKLPDGYEIGSCVGQHLKATNVRDDSWLQREWTFTLIDKRPRTPIAKKSPAKKKISKRKRTTKKSEG